MENIKNAANLIEKGELVSFPTETVYGLGANACDSDAVLKIYQMKKRPDFNPLICHVAHQDAIADYAVLKDLDMLLAQAFWPGPMTLILDKKQNTKISDLVTAGLNTVGFRVPEHPTAHQLLSAVNCPIAAPSANVSGQISPTSFEHVEAAFSDAVYILNGEAPSVGIESTILRCHDQDVEILRPGSITKEMIEALIGRPCLERMSSNINAPGQMTSHYAPKAKLILNNAQNDSADGFIDFGGQFKSLPENIPYVDLSPKGDLSEAAKNLFAVLHKLDKCASTIIVAKIPDHGIGIALNDRLKRAAAPKDDHAR